MKENLKPCVYKLWKDYDVAQSRLTRTKRDLRMIVGALSKSVVSNAKSNRVLFVERSGELRIPARLSG